MGQDGGCDGLVTGVSAPRVDLLVYVAGILENDTLDSIDYASCTQQFNVNTLGLLRTVTALRPKLTKGSRVLVLGSLLGSITNSVNSVKPGRVRFPTDGCEQLVC